MTTNPFSTTPPTIPSLATIGGAALINDPDFPPIPTQQPTADQLNLHDICAAAAVLMMPFIIITAHPSGPNYILDGIRTPNPNISAADITLTKTGTGEISVTVTSGKLPSASHPLPQAWTSVSAIFMSATGTSTGADVEINDAVGAADAAFSLALWGHA